MMSDEEEIALLFNVLRRRGYRTEDEIRRCLHDYNFKGFQLPPECEPETPAFCYLHARQRMKIRIQDVIAAIDR